MNALAPGIFPSNMTRFGIQENIKEMEAGQPLGRIGNEGDISGAVLFLCSRAGAHICGAVIPVDGGASLTAGPKL